MTVRDLRIELFYCVELLGAEAPYFWIEAHQAKESKTGKETDYPLEWEKPKGGEV
jgi:hypothetical protein